MKRVEDATPAAWGFLSVLEHEQIGLVGGYLILNATGRPLEFHCTAPVKPNRAQQILFGPTLDAYLYGEQIGQTLLAKGSLEPAAVYTDSERVLAVREFVRVPVALVLPASQESSGDGAQLAATTGWRVARTAASQLATFEVGSNNLAVALGRDADRDSILARLDESATFDLAEPFERIREAVAEAHKANRPEAA